MSLIGRLGAQPQTATDKQGREILIYSVATTDRAGPAGADGSEFVCMSPMWLTVRRKGCISVVCGSSHSRGPPFFVSCICKKSLLTCFPQSSSAAVHPSHSSP